MANVCRETAYTCGAETQQQLADQVVEEVVTEQVVVAHEQQHEQIAATGQLSEEIVASGQVVTTEEIDAGEVVELIQVKKVKYQQ